MNATLLTYKSLQNGKSWYLATCNLFEYLQSIKSDAFDYDIQRRIVKNSFLDKLWESVISEEPFPAITITVQDAHEKDGILTIDDYDILDGLQRTFRLWSIVYLHGIVEQNNVRDVKDIINIMKEDKIGNRILESGIMNRTIIRKLLDQESEVELHKIIDAYKRFDIVLYVWTGLNDDEIIKKMLILNAGQRSVSSTHQFELMFLHYFNQLTIPRGVRIIREKDPDYFAVKNKERECGQFLMSSIIIALQSFLEKEPVRIKPANALRIDDTVVQMSYADYFSKDNLSLFIQILYNFDRRFSKYATSQWLMKDTTLSGIFAAVGKYLETKDDTADGNLQDINECLNRIDQNNIQYEKFKVAYNNLSSTSINIGNVLRKGIFNFFLNLFMGKQTDWEKSLTKKNGDE